MINRDMQYLKLINNRKTHVVRTKQLRFVRTIAEKELLPDLIDLFWPGLIDFK